jgi:hypothetical protein
MTEPEIVDAVAQLRREIDKLSADNQEARERLEGLLANLEQNLQAPKDDGVPLIEDMQEAISQFEVEHPRITGIINDIMIALGNMGI